jgi:hypothetical protein
LRKSFNFAPRASGSIDRDRNIGFDRRQSQELKDIPHTPLPTLVPTATDKLLNADFQLGSEGSSKATTPALRVDIGRVGSPLTIPVSNPDDPASYPLPPSPELATSALKPEEKAPGDPLGASPDIEPRESSDVQGIDVQESTPVVEKRTFTAGSSADEGENIVGGSSSKSRSSGEIQPLRTSNGFESEVAVDVVDAVDLEDLDDAKRRYAGMSSLVKQKYQSTYLLC